MQSLRQLVFLSVAIFCGLAVDIGQDYIDKISSLDLMNFKEADFKKLADDILSAPLGAEDMKMLDPLIMDNPELFNDLKKLEDPGVQPLDKLKPEMAPSVIPLQSDTRRVNSTALESEKSKKETPQTNNNPTNINNNMPHISQPSYDQMTYQVSNFPQYPQAKYDQSNFRRSDASETQQLQDPSRPCLPYSYDNPYLERFLQPPQPFVVPLKIFYEKVKHDHPTLHEIQNIIKKDKKEFHDYKHGKHLSSDETRERYRSSDLSSSSRDYSESSSEIDYYDDFIPIKG